MGNESMRPFFGDIPFTSDEDGGLPDVFGRVAPEMEPDQMRSHISGPYKRKGKGKRDHSGGVVEDSLPDHTPPERRAFYGRMAELDNDLTMAERMGNQQEAQRIRAEMAILHKDYWGR